MEGIFGLFSHISMTNVHFYYRSTKTKTLQYLLTALSSSTSLILKHHTQGGLNVKEHLVNGDNWAEYAIAWQQFYTCWLSKCFSEFFVVKMCGPFIGHLLGTIIATYPLSISTSFYHKRYINVMIGNFDCIEQSYKPLICL